MKKGRDEYIWGPEFDTRQWNNTKQQKFNICNEKNLIIMMFESVNTEICSVRFWIKSFIFFLFFSSFFQYRFKCRDSRDGEKKKLNRK